MEIFYTIWWFIFGTCLGSFYHVVGDRLPKGETLLKPKHSYCPTCKHELKKKDLIPIISYISTLGKCRYCKKNISIFYPIIELITGVLFALSFHRFGYSYEFFVAIILSSMFSVILVSDINYLIIPDEVLIVGDVLLIILSLIFNGIEITVLNIGNGIFMFFVMYLIMIAGNFIFKKESLGGADIKLMATSGFTLGSFMSFCVIFISSIIALPISIILYIKNKEKMIPYGPFIMIAILIIFMLEINIDKILTLIV